MPHCCSAYAATGLFSWIYIDFRQKPGSWISVAFMPQAIPIVHEGYNLLENRDIFPVRGNCS
jgi:hypothetical protein